MDWIGNMAMWFGTKHLFNMHFKVLIDARYMKLKYSNGNKICIRQILI